MIYDSKPPRIKAKRPKKPVDPAALARRRAWVNYGYVKRSWQVNASLGKS